MNFKDHILDAAVAITAIAALFVSMCANKKADAAHEDTESAQALSSAYSTFAEVNKLQIEHPELSHVLADSEDYDETVKLVRSAIGTPTDQMRSRLRLQEAALAFVIFAEYDRLISAEGLASNMKQGARDEILSGTLDFYSKQLLRNPRLLAYWRDLGGSKYFSDETVDYYKRNVLADDEKPANLKYDPIGPFAAPAPSQSTRQP